MLIKVTDNLIVNTDHIAYVYGSTITMNGGAQFKLDEIGMRNMGQVADAMVDKLLQEVDKIDLQ